MTANRPGAPPRRQVRRHARHGPAAPGPPAGGGRSRGRGPPSTLARIQRLTRARPVAVGVGEGVPEGDGRAGCDTRVRSASQPVGAARKVTIPDRIHLLSGIRCFIEIWAKWAVLTGSAPVGSMRRAPGLYAVARDRRASRAQHACPDDPSGAGRAWPGGVTAAPYPATPRRGPGGLPVHWIERAFDTATAPGPYEDAVQPERPGGSQRTRRAARSFDPTARCGRRRGAPCCGAAVRSGSVLALAPGGRIGRWSSWRPEGCRRVPVAVPVGRFFRCSIMYVMSSNADG